MLWSSYIQTPHYLDATRQILLSNELRNLIKQHCGIFDRSRVLEVGCGTGCFLSYISAETYGINFVGIDRDEKFLENGKSVRNDNHVQYIKSTVYDMPFEENFFDTVCSHTFFNCVEDPYFAMKEIKRVAKEGAYISSITSMAFDSTMMYEGNYPKECKWNNLLKKLKHEYRLILESLCLGPNGISSGISTAEMPSFFCQNGLKKVSTFPIGYSFSLSDSYLTIEEKKRFNENMYVGEIAQLDELCGYKRFLDLLSV